MRGRCYGPAVTLATTDSLRFSAPRAPDLFRHARYRPDLAIAPFLPTTRAEMDALGWDACDIVLISGDAYIDHPSFGMALIGRLLEANGFRVGIIPQPDWHSAEPFRELGRPLIYFGVTGGNMDSMVNRYTSDRRIRSNDAYTPDGAGGKRPDRAVLVYAQRCREAFKGVPVVLGGIGASLRRIAHFDYWSEKVRRSVLLDAKGDILLFGNAERALVELTHRVAAGEAPRDVRDLRGTAWVDSSMPEGWVEVDSSDADVVPGRTAKGLGADRTVIRLPSYETVAEDSVQYAHASRILHRESNPGNARALVQRHGKRELWITPPPVPLTTTEMDRVYELPYARAPHPRYEGARLPAWDMIRHSITIQRGCFGGCTFCSITEHEGRIIQNRSEDSILREIETIRDTQKGFTGVISDLGGPTANMYRIACKSREIEAACRRPSCVFPGICENLNTDHSALISLYRKARKLPGIKKVLVASGVRYDLASEDPRYVKELVTHHVGGYLKIAPEHVAEAPLDKMMKPGMGTYEQYLIPYFIAAHPGTTDEDMLELAQWLKANGFKADQVQTFLPSPMATATAMYHSGKNPLRRVTHTSEDVVIPRGIKVRRLHKAFLRWHDPDNWPLLRDALKRMGRAELIGSGPNCLIPVRQPPGWVKGGSGADATDQSSGPKNSSAKNSSTRKKDKARRFSTQHTGVESAAFPRRGSPKKGGSGRSGGKRRGR